MSTIMIKSDPESNQLLGDLAKKLGGNVIDIEDESFEEIAFGKQIDEMKTGVNVLREDVFEILSKNRILSSINRFSSLLKKLKTNALYSRLNPQS